MCHVARVRVLFDGGVRPDHSVGRRIETLSVVQSFIGHMPVFMLRLPFHKADGSTYIPICPRYTGEILYLNALYGLFAHCVSFGELQFGPDSLKRTMSWMSCPVVGQSCLWGRGRTSELTTLDQSLSLQLDSRHSVTDTSCMKT